MVAVVPIAGILVYFMLRPRETLSEKYVRALEEESLLSSIEDQEFCPTCSRRVGADMQFCPSCHTKLRNPCANCGRAVHLSWDLCPYCGNTLVPEMPSGAINVKRPALKRVATPQPSPVSPGTKVTQPASQSLRARLSLGGMLDKVGGAIGGMVDKVTPMRDDNAPSTETIPPVVNTNGNGSPPRPISSVKKPPINREELE